VIGPLHASHAARVADLHARHLRTGLRGATGHGLLRAYYTTVAAGHGAVGYVAESAGDVVGYVCGVWAPARVRAHLVTAHWPALVVGVAAQLVARPATVASLARRLRGDGGTPVAPHAYELRPIVVAPAARGTGVAAGLVAVLLDDARTRGFPMVHLVVETDNHAARAFYAKVGFRPDGTLRRDGIEHVRYVRETEHDTKHPRGVAA
jgi:GNAT superfamily N-acetyltransferase